MSLRSSLAQIRKLYIIGFEFQMHEGSQRGRRANEQKVSLIYDHGNESLVNSHHSYAPFDAYALLANIEMFGVKRSLLLMSCGVSLGGVSAR